VSGGDITYVVDNVSYEVDKFTDEGKIIFARLVEVQQEVNNFSRKIDILKAAAVTLNNKLKEQVTEDMKTTLGDAVEDWEKEKAS